MGGLFLSCWSNILQSWGRAGEISSYRGRGDEEVLFLVFVGGPDWGGVEELFNLREGGRGRIVGGRGREREGGRGREEVGREREGGGREGGRREGEGGRRREREGEGGREGKKSGM